MAALRPLTRLPPLALLPFKRGSLKHGFQSSPAACTALRHLFIPASTLRSSLISFRGIRGTLERDAATIPSVSKPTDATAVDFNWQLGVALAGCSFESYADIDQKGLVQRSTTGVDVVYTNGRFLRDKMAGLLKMGGQALACEIENFDDVKVSKPLHWQISLGEDSCADLPLETKEDQEAAAKESSAKENSAKEGKEESSDEGEGIFLFVRDPSRQRLILRLMDSKGVVVGLGTSQLAFLENNNNSSNNGEDEHEISIEVTGDDLPTALAVTVYARFLPFSELLAEDGSPAATAAAGLPESINLLGTPGPALMTESWRKLVQSVMQASAAAYEPIAYIENKSTNTQLWLFWSLPRRELVLAFRGTEQSKWRDILTDISFAPVALHTHRMSSSPRNLPLTELSAEPGPVAKVLSTVEQAKKETASLRSSSTLDDQEAETGAISAAVGAVTATATQIQEVLTHMKAVIDREEAVAVPASEEWVHSGFLTAYDSVRGSVLGVVDTILATEDTNSSSDKGSSDNGNNSNGAEKSNGIESESSTESSRWSVLLTGHSLGGALATVCAHDLSHRPWPPERRPKLSVYNYGSPRVGNRPFAREFNAAVPDTWRVVNRNDAVSTVPRLMGYAHVGHAVLLGMGEDGGVQVQRDSSEAPFEGVAAGEVLPAVGAAVAAAVASAAPAVMEGIGREIRGSGSFDSSGSTSSIDGGSSNSSEISTSTGRVGPEELGSLWETEKEAWSVLLQGTAVSEHMEDLYFESIEKAVEQWRATAAKEEREEAQNINHDEKPKE